MDTFSISDEHMFRIHGAIEQHGLFVMAVGSTPTWPSWAYTIGLLEHGHPELVTVGLSPESAHWFLTQVYDRVAAGAPPAIGRQHRHVVEGQIPLDISLIELPDLQWTAPSDLVPCTLAYYEARGGFPSDTRVCQLVWPDFESRLPWDPGFDESFSKYQPLLDEVRWEHDRPHDGECGPQCDLWSGNA